MSASEHWSTSYCWCAKVVTKAGLTQHLNKKHLDVTLDDWHRFLPHLPPTDSYLQCPSWPLRFLNTLGIPTHAKNVHTNPAPHQPLPQNVPAAEAALPINAAPPPPAAPDYPALLTSSSHSLYAFHYSWIAPTRTILLTLRLTISGTSAIADLNITDRKSVV